VKAYKNNGDHVIDVASGQMVGVGEVIYLSAADEREPHNARMIKSGVLTAAEVKKEDKKSSSPKEGDEA
jgi:hypothetical protein